MPSTVPTPLPSTAAHTNPTVSNPPLSNSTPSAPSLPTGNTFDILPPLHDILLRLLDTPAEAEGALSTSQNTGPLEPSRLPDATISLKRKIQKAREAVDRLPDIDRGVEEQQEEIQALESRVKALQGVLEGLGKANKQRGQQGVSKMSDHFGSQHLST